MKPWNNICNKKCFNL